MYLLDTDIFIDLQRGHPPAVEWFRSLDELPAVPGIVVMELIQDAQDSRQVREALKLVAPLRSSGDRGRLPPALSDFTAYHLSHRLGLLDAIIAACAVGLAATLYTFNVKHYRAVPGLLIEQPYSR